MRKTTSLRRLIESPKLSFLMEVHNGISAKIADEAGFEGLWGSGLSISAACGVRDNNELSWTQVLDILEYATDNTSVPLLFDGDTGYGNFNNMRRLVGKLEARDVAGVCIEDKLFPKTNSFIDGKVQPLASIDEFCGKIKAGKDSQQDDDFVIVARVEAFIAGWGLNEALKRAEAYRDAGADAILMHSKLSRPDEVLAFKKEWANRCPVVIVPTKYYSTPTEVFEQAGFSAVIWANQLMRSSIKAMMDTASHLARERSLLGIEERISPLSEVFRLQGADELKQAEKKYLPRKKSVGALILAASRGHELRELTEDKPKVMIPIGGQPLLHRLVGTFRDVGIRDITVVRGYKKDTVQAENLLYVDNDEYESTKEVYSLAGGLRGLDSEALISYGDVLYHKHIPMRLLESTADFCIAANADWQDSQNKDRYGDYVTCDKPYARHEFDRATFLKKMEAGRGSELSAEPHGEWMGLVKFSVQGLKFVKNLLENNVPDDELRRMRMFDLFNKLAQHDKKIEVLYFHGQWFDIDEMKDVISAGNWG